MFSKRKISPENDVQLSQLLRMKRQERPDDAFWGKFDEELRSKQLSALVRTQSWYERTGKLALLIARKSAAATATLSIFALGIFTISKTEFFSMNPADSVASGPVSEMEATEEPHFAETPIFIVDRQPVSNEVTDLEIPKFDAAPYYEVNALTKGAVPVSYQIIAEPKQFTAGSGVSDTSLGAKVIRTGIDF